MPSDLGTHTSDSPKLIHHHLKYHWDRQAVTFSDVTTMTESYFDTEDLLLADSGIYFRHRQIHGSDYEQWTVRRATITNHGLALRDKDFNTLGSALQSLSSEGRALQGLSLVAEFDVFRAKDPREQGTQHDIVFSKWHQRVFGVTTLTVSPFSEPGQEQFFQSGTLVPSKLASFAVLEDPASPLGVHFNRLLEEGHTAHPEYLDSRGTTMGARHSPSFQRLASSRERWN